MRLIKRVMTTLLALVLGLFLLPMLLILFLVSTWRMAGLMEKLRERMPVEGEFHRERVVMVPIPVDRNK